MKTLVVCLDGTGQKRPQPDLTNIALIFDACGGVCTDGENGSWERVLTEGAAVVQVAKYLPGVGTQGNFILRVLGEGFGAGIAEQVVRGYTYLSREFSPGDQIIITGFSRGATAARALAGLVAELGLLNPKFYDVKNKNIAYLRAIAAWYQYRTSISQPARDASLASIAAQAGDKIPTITSTDFVEVEAIQAIGVFDTVSSLGVPVFDSTGWPAFDFHIIDTVLHPKVLRGFHALSADETRSVFSPTFWTPREGITQVIFPGSHSNVGGGYPETGLSDGALIWMLSNLRSCPNAWCNWTARPS